jgi:hypothetical protein
MEPSTETTEFYRSSTWSLLGVAGPAISLVGIRQSDSAILYACLLILAFSFVEVIWARRRPFVALSASGIVIRPAFLSLSHSLAYTEIAGWTHSARWLGFETIQSKRIYLPLLLKKSERIRLLERLQSLQLGQPDCPKALARHLSSGTVASPPAAADSPECRRSSGRRNTGIASTPERAGCPPLHPPCFQNRRTPPQTRR